MIATLFIVLFTCISSSSAGWPTEAPTRAPLRAPTRAPTRAPSREPSQAPIRAPTRAPTRVPSREPTRSPTREPTRSPTRAPSREPTRAPTREPTEAPVNIESCLTLEIHVEVENPLPDPTEPDPPTMIWLLGQGATMTLNSYLKVEYEEELFPSIQVPGYNNVSQLTSEQKQNFTTQIGNDCEKTVSDKYLEPSVTLFTTPTNVNCVDLPDGRFVINMTMTTEESIAYKFNLPELTMYITTDCPDGVSFMLYITAEDEEWDTFTSDLIMLYPDDENLTYIFDPAVELNSNSEYIIDIELFEYGQDCDQSNIFILDRVATTPGTTGTNDTGNDTVILYRRRLITQPLDEWLTSIQQDGISDACTLGEQVAASESMKYALETLCSDTPPDTVQLLQEGLFRRYVGQNAMQNHMISTGSLLIFNSSGTEISSTDIGAEEPCVAMDEDNNLVFVIGGHDGNGSAVDTIEVYEFSNGIESGESGIRKTSFIFQDPLGFMPDEEKSWEDLTLDKPRYGASCYFYRKDQGQIYLVVVGGMGNRDYLTTPSEWYQDIRMIHLHNVGTFSPDLDEDNIVNNEEFGYITDSKPFIEVGQPFMYVWGGRNDTSARNEVFGIDMDDIVAGNCPKWAPLTSINVPRSEPLVEENIFDGDRCYMVWGGVKNACTIADENCEIDQESLMLFCGMTTKYDICGEGDCEPPVVQRRLIEDDVNSIGFSDWDKKNLVKQEDVPKGEEDGAKIYIRHFDFTNDGIWYTIKTNLTFCFDDIDQVNVAEDLYTSFIDASPNGALWNVYADRLNANILNVSQKQYMNYSLGFGDVNVVSIDIINIDYRYSNTPTPIPAVVSSPEPTKSSKPKSTK